MNLVLVVGAGVIQMLIMRSQPNVGDFHTGRTVISLFGRISMVVGLEWISGLLSYLIPTSTVIQYAFVILVSLHGFWVLIAIVTLEFEGLMKKITDKTTAQDMMEQSGSPSENTEPGAANMTGETGAKQLGDSGEEGAISQMETSKENRDEIQASNDEDIELEIVKSKVFIWKRHRAASLDVTTSSDPVDARVSN